MDEARKTLTAAYDRTRDQVVKKEASLQSLVSIATTFQQFFDETNEAETKAKLDETDKIVHEALDGPAYGVADIRALFDLKMSSASGLVYSDAKKAEEAFDSLSEEIEKYGSKIPESEQSAIDNLKKMIDRQMGSVDSALKREALIGTEAPELSPESFVAMEPTTMHDLRGKVVLIDFWAVWCGPCIATFPHLKHLHDEYSKDGLVILGVTQPYNYEWNEEANRAQRAANGVEVSMDDELEMLEKFRAHHELRHGFVVNAKGSKYSSEFQVSGIPQAAVIDKQGKIRLIRVGSGDANSKAIESTIKTLLAE